MSRAFAVAAAAVALVACSKPEPPKITAESAKITTISATGIDLEAHLAIENPNGVTLSARSVTATITLDDRINLGTVTVPRELELPARSTTKMDVPLKATWSDVQSIVLLGASGKDVPYKIEGKLNLGGKLLNVDVPFTLKGTMTNAELSRAFWSSIPFGAPKK